MDLRSLKRQFPKKEQPATPFYLSIAGNIGVGKSMITTMLGEVFGWRMFFEPVINNPYLDDYYRDMQRWSFHLQVYFLSKRVEVQRQILMQPGSAVQDRTIYEDVEIFPPTLHRRGCRDDGCQQVWAELCDSEDNTFCMDLYLASNDCNLRWIILVVPPVRVLITKN